MLRGSQEYLFGKTTCVQTVTTMILGLCWGWYGQLIRDLRRRSSILQQPARDRVATATKPVAASRLWCAIPVKHRKKIVKLQNLIGSPPKFDTLLAVWYPTYMQSFIISHSSCAEQYGDMSSDTQTHSHTHTIKPPTAGVQLVGHTSITHRN